MFSRIGRLMREGRQAVEVIVGQFQEQVSNSLSTVSKCGCKDLRIENFSSNIKHM